MADKKALLVIDMQNDYLWEKRKAKFSYDTAALVGAVNEAIASCQRDGVDVIYIEQVFPNLITNRWLIGFSIRGTEGAELFGGLSVVSELVFEKNLPDAYSSKEFRDFMKEKAYTEVVLCGLDECGCVGATAKGAIAAGAKVTMLEKCIGCRFSREKVLKMRQSLKALGVVYQ